jgi:hypothetical protein
VPAIPELSASEKGDIGTLSEGAQPVGEAAPKEARPNGAAPEAASPDTAGQRPEK